MNPASATGVDMEKAEHAQTAYKTDQPSASQYTLSSVDLGFLRNVYVSILVQLAVTAGFVALFQFESHTIELAVQQKGMLSWILVIGVAASAMLIIFGFVILITKARRAWPWNLVLVGLFTVSVSFLFTSNTWQFKSEEVSIAFEVFCVLCLGFPIILMGIVALVCVCQGFPIFENTKRAKDLDRDFPNWNIMLCAVLLSLIALGILCYCLPSKVLYILSSCVKATFLQQLFSALMFLPV